MNVSEFLQDHARKLAAAREHACEAALLTGSCGVLETHLPGGAVEFEVSPDVPYGQIYEHHLW